MAQKSTSQNPLDKIPLLTIDAGPKDPKWMNRLKEEYMVLIKYQQLNKQEDNDWFKVESNNDGTKHQIKRWHGMCWYVHNLVRYEFKVQFEIPPTYPSSPFEIELPELDGLTSKMYRGGKICLDIHFAPLWAKNTPKFGIAHAFAIALGPWLAVEIPVLVDNGKIQKK